MPPAGRTGFDASRPWRLDDEVGLRPERDGAIAYHYRSRQLVLVTDPTLAGVLASLDAHPDAESALAAAGVTGTDRAAYTAALDRLAASGVIRERPR